MAALTLPVYTHIDEQVSLKTLSYMRSDTSGRTCSREGVTGMGRGMAIVYDVSPARGEAVDCCTTSHEAFWTEVTVYACI